MQPVLESDMPTSPLLGVVDLGSNSFRLLVARVERDKGAAARIGVIDQHKEAVRLAAGLDAHMRLDAAAQDRALCALARFRLRLQQHAPAAVRVVATNTLRVAADADGFVNRAQTELGHPIEVISGREEARLIYRGASCALGAASQPRLVLDIGGGSTELIVGRGEQIDALDSIALGCVALTRRHFADGRIDRARWDAALDEAYERVLPVARTLRWRRWDSVWGTSGTFKALVRLVRAQCDAEALDQDNVRRLRDALVAAGHVDRIGLAGLRDDRRPVLPGGVVAAQALLELLPIRALRYAAGALREGVLLELAACPQARPSGAPPAGTSVRGCAIERQPTRSAMRL